LHKIARSDNDRDAHDHPWRWATLILWGGYNDEQWGIERDTDGKPVRRVGPFWQKMFPGRLAFRRPDHLHRVRLHDDGSLGERASWSLVWMAKKSAEWGFVTEDGTKIPWRKYLNEENEA
jgi:hypothetical protein